MGRADPVEHSCVFGLGWGDEGKGKIVDLLCPAFEMVVRFNGGANAGHTVCVGEEKFALHLLPSGVLHEGAIGVIGPGVVVDPITLLVEIDQLSARGVEVTKRLRISERAHLVLAYHILEDQLGEQAAAGRTKIGTTARGIGPCYADKMRRTSAIRFADLVHNHDWESRVRHIVELKRGLFESLCEGAVDLQAEKIIDDLRVAGNRLKPLICDTTALLHEAIASNKPVLFEGANGMLLDIDHGTYPYVTSSSTGPHGIGVGSGVPPWAVTRRIGTIKAYATRVGEGPFVSELDDDIGAIIRERGHEFGTTTGRPRRCGWFDAVSGAYAVRLSAATDIALMHLDTLSGLERVGICTGYKIEGQSTRSFPSHRAQWERTEPIFEFLPGWNDDLTGLRTFDDLPINARAYVDRVESLLGAPVTLVGVGPERSQTLLRGSICDLLG